jgi:hypothetical protein
LPFGQANQKHSGTWDYLQGTNAMPWRWLFICSSSSVLLALLASTTLVFNVLLLTWRIAAHGCGLNSTLRSIDRNFFGRIFAIIGYSVSTARVDLRLCGCGVSGFASRGFANFIQVRVATLAF